MYSLSDQHILSLVHQKYQKIWVNWWQNFLPFALGVLSSSDEFWSTWNLTFSFFTTIASKCPFEMLSRSSIISDNFSLRFLLAPRSSSTFSKNRCFSWLRFFWDRARYFAKSSADSSLTFLSLKSEMKKNIYCTGQLFTTIGFQWVVKGCLTSEGILTLVHASKRCQITPLRWKFVNLFTVIGGKFKFFA